MFDIFDLFDFVLPTPDRTSLAPFLNAFFSRIRVLRHYYSEDSPGAYGKGDPYAFRQPLIQLEQKLKKLLNDKFGISMDEMKWDATKKPSFSRATPLLLLDSSLQKRKQSHQEEQGSKKGRI